VESMKKHQHQHGDLREQRAHRAVRSPATPMFSAVAASRSTKCSHLHTQRQAQNHDSIWSLAVTVKGAKRKSNAPFAERLQRIGVALLRCRQLSETACIQLAIPARWPASRET
jgi:hypothetical protein